VSALALRAISYSVITITFIEGRPCVWSSQQRIGACAMTMTKMFTLMGLVVVISLSPVIIGLIYVLV
jgi:hypothetical protein